MIPEALIVQFTMRIYIKFWIARDIEDIQRLFSGVPICMHTRVPSTTSVDSRVFLSQRFLHYIDNAHGDISGSVEITLLQSGYVRNFPEF